LVWILFFSTKLILPIKLRAAIFISQSAAADWKNFKLVLFEKKLTFCLLQTKVKFKDYPLFGLAAYCSLPLLGVFTNNHHPGLTIQRESTAADG